MSYQPIKMVLAGAGLMGKTHLEAAKDIDSVEYVGVVDINVKMAKALSAEFGPKAFSALSVAIEELKPDAVDI